MENFHFLSDIGKIPLPSKSEISKHFELTGEQIILVLDSSVCLDIIKLVDHKNKATSDKQKIYNLIDYSQKNEVDFFSIFALVESCYNRTTLKIQSDKFFDFNCRIQFAFFYPLKKLRKFHYNFEDNFYAIKPKPTSAEPAEIIIDSRINPYYVGLLKIAQIAQKNGVSKHKAEKNIESFINWMEDDLNFFLGQEYMLALNIFGGNTAFGSMLKIGGKKEAIIKATWGTAWDMFHAKMSINRDLISELIEKKVFPIFVTNDVTLYNLMSPYVDSYVKRNFKKVTIIQNNAYPPFFSNDFMDKLNERMTKLTIERFYNENELDSEHVRRLITELEGSIV